MNDYLWPQWVEFDQQVEGNSLQLFFKIFLKTRDFQKWNGLAQEGVNSPLLGASLVCSSALGSIKN